MDAHPPLIKGIQGDLKEIGDLTLRQQMQALGLTLSKIKAWVRERFPISLTTSTHAYRPRDAIWIKEWNVQMQKSHWRSPFVVILSTPTAVKVAEIVPWIHHSWVNPASLKWECIPDPASQCKITLLNISALPWQDSALQETIGDQEQWDDSPALVIPGS
jgi:hypothetical protein